MHWLKSCLARVKFGRVWGGEGMLMKAEGGVGSPHTTYAVTLQMKGML